MIDKNPKSLILEALVNHPKGLTMVSLAEVVGLHRHTATKYLYELIGAGLIHQRKVGPARLCYLKETIEENQTEMPTMQIQESTLKTHDKKWFGGKSQIRFIAIFLLLGIILVSSTVIASNFLNETFGSTSPTGKFISDSTANVISGQSDPTIENVENIQHASTEDNNINIILINNETSETIDTSKSETINKNFTTEITEPANSSNNLVNNNETSENPETNNTDVSKTINDTLPIEIPPLEVEKPNLKVDIEYSKKITRGDQFTIKAKIENAGSSVAKGVDPRWILPKEFEIVSEKEDCENLEQNSFCTSKITLKIPFSAELGLNEIKIVVNYET